MKTAFTLSLALMASALASPGYASSPFPETFEEHTELSEIGWEATSSVPDRFQWSIAEYSAETKQFPVNIPIPEIGGAKCLKGLTGGFNTAAAPDIRLVSPAFTVEAGASNLRFLYCNNMVTNGAGNVAEADRAVFTVAVAPQGGNAEEDFTDVLFEEVPVNKHLWRVVNLDLSQYAGKEVRLQFRCKMANPAKPFTYNFLYIDNLELTAASCPDLQATALTGLVAGTLKEQYPTVTFVNNGSAATGVELMLSAEGAESVSEILSEEVAAGATVEHTFNTPIVLPAGFNSTVNVEIKHADDPFTENNSTSATAQVYAAGELPFTLLEGTEAQEQMITTAKGTAKTPDGWQFLTNIKAWVSTNNKKEAYLYPAQAFHLTDKPLKISFAGNLVGESANFKVYLTKRADDFGEPVASTAMVNGEVSNVILAPVAQEGDYLIAFKIEDYAALKNQFKLTALEIKEAAGNPDLALMTLLPSGALLADKPASVTLQLTNQGAEDATDVEVSYAVGETTVTENIAKVASGETVDYTFEAPLTLAAGQYVLKASVAHELDKNEENNSMEASLTAYAPKPLPYRESFETESEAALWSYPEGSDWFVSDIYNFDGTHMLCLPGKAFATHDDWVISPAIEIPADFKGRLSFYYGAGGNAGTAVIDAYITPASTPAEIAAGEPIVSKPAGSVDVDYASIMVENLEAGTYYIAFHAKDGAQSLLLDDIRLDANNELSIEGISLSTPVQAGYEHEPAKVTVRGHNYGMEPLSNFKVAYQALISSFGETKTTEAVSATYTDEVAPGEEYEFTFEAPLEFKETGIYIVAAAISCEKDADTKNNGFQVMGPEVLPTRTLPALYDNERDDYLHGYIYPDGTGWGLRALNQYAGEAALYHMGKNGNATDGDWVFLNRVFIPAGTYQASAFWKTMTGFDTEEYEHKFDITLSDAPAITANHQVILSNTVFTSSDKKARKELNEITVEKDGYYFLGIHLKECGGQGSLTIDDIKIEAPEAKYDLTAMDATYQSDFGNAPDEWYHYHPVKLYSQQWNAVTDPSGILHALQAIEFTANGTTYTASYLQAPPMLMAADNYYKLTIQTQINDAPYTDEIDWTALTGDEEFVIYESDVDLPQEFKEIGRIKAKEYVKEYTIKPEKTGIKYISVGTANAKCAAFTFVGLNVKNEGVTGISAIESESEESRWYTIDGIETPRPAPGTHGIYIRVTGEKAEKVIL